MTLDMKGRVCYTMYREREVHSMTDKRLEKLIALRRALGEVINDNTGEPRFAEVIAKMKAKGLHVYHVIDSTYILGGVDEVHMTSYCYISEEDDLDNNHFLKAFKDGYCYANVVNDTWGIEELGEIAFDIRYRMMSRTA
jgi:hypothetical protein